MDAPSAVLGVVLLETAVGGLALLWLAPTWGAVRRGYVILLGSTLGLVALGAWGAMRAPLAAGHGGGPAAAWASRGLLATAILTLLAVGVAARSDGTAARVLGLTGVVAGVGTFVPLAQLRAVAAGAGGGAVSGLAELALGAFFLGAVWDGLVLGHWYLVERRLSNRYMVWMAWVNVAAVAAGFGAVALSAANPPPCAGLAGRELAICRLPYSPILSIGSFTIVMGTGLVALVALIAAFNVKLAREGGRSIQASTGMFYLAVILAPAAEFAAKVRFF
ncbi:MAG TPA: hypothetical protein VHF25_02540 [Nitriliruptorales bacterium]|nr:hypothetical protein [Nitriliruptorales bacterium]